MQATPKSQGIGGYMDPAAKPYIEDECWYDKSVTVDNAFQQTVNDHVDNTLRFDVTYTVQVYAC